MRRHTIALNVHTVALNVHTIAHDRSAVISYTGIHWDDVFINGGHIRQREMYRGICDWSRPRCTRVSESLVVGASFILRSTYCVRWVDAIDSVVRGWCSVVCVDALLSYASPPY